MTCTTCGRENPPHLTFCQECGQRLGPRIAPPTPPIGLGGDAGADYAPPPPQRPVMPDPFANAPPRNATSLGAGPSPLGGGPPVAPPRTVAMDASAPPRRCRVCDTPNGPNLRYCTSCGSTLEPPVPVATASAPRMLEQAPVAVPAPAPNLASPAPSPSALGGAAALAASASVAPAHAPGPSAGPPPAAAAVSPQASFGGAPPPPIAPMRVVDLGTGGRPNEAPRTCARCRGVVDGNAQFCKFCGAPLAEAAPRDANANGHAAPAYGAPPNPPAAAYGAPPNPPAAAYGAPPNPPAAAYGAPPNPPAAPYGAPPPAPPTHAAPPAPPPPAPLQVETPPPPPVAAAQAAAVAPSIPSAAIVSAREPQKSVTRGRLVVIAKSGADGPSYPIGDTLDVGRLEGQVIVGEDPYLSPRHVRLVWKDKKMLLRDLGSTNGVFLRLVGERDMNLGRRARPTDPPDASLPGEVAVPLQDQDLILVGQQVLRFEVAKDGEAGYGPATEHGTLLFGSPAAPRYARLSQRTVEGITRDVYYVRKVETVLGRESGDVVFTEDPFLSRRHAAVRLLGPGGVALAPGAKLPSPESGGVGFALVDLGSSNGTFLKIRGDVELVPGDHFRVGQQLFRVDFQG